MLRIIQNSSVSGAMNYFTSADYLSEGQELAGQWRGKAAAMLRLSGEIAHRDWVSLCMNRDPRSGETLTQRLKSQRRVGYDFNFRAPKSLSLLYGLTGDARLLEAFRGAVNATMGEMEAEMQTRVRKGGKDADRTTGNMAWGEWIHTTGRPVEGIPDPHLHAHCFVFNTTWDRSEERWKAGQFAGLKRDAPYFEAVFHSRLAERLADLGLPISRGKSGWEIEGISKAVRDKFSRRTALIEEAATEKGIVDPEAKMELSAQTREKKRNDLSLKELRRNWESRLNESESEAFWKLAERVGTRPVEREAGSAERAASLAVSHMFERKAVVPERMLLRDALRRSAGQASVEATERAVRDQGLILADSNGRRFATTQQVLGEEERMIDFARRGRGTCPALVAGEHVFTANWLNSQQRAAVLHLLSGHDRVMAVAGRAGVGKTTMAKEAVTAIEAAGTKVFMFAPSADASRGVLRDEGFANADTVAMLLKNPKVQEQVRGGVLWIDEAGQLSTPTMTAIFDLAKRENCRVILTGDGGQHGSVERGDVLRLLEQEAGIKPAEIREIQRQKDRYRDAVAAVSEGRLEDGFHVLDELGWIDEIEDSRQRYAALADDYLASTRGNKECLVVSPTHAEAELVTSAIRAKLREAGRLQGAEHEVLCLKNRNLTEGERGDKVNYEPGDVLVYHQNAKGVQKGQHVLAGDGPLPVEQAARFQVFRQESLRLAKGDQIRVTRNGKTLDGHTLVNGTTYQVKDFTRSGDIVLANGWHVARDFGHLAYGYVSTSYSSQGKTVDRVLIAQSSASPLASSLQQFYVSLSRGRFSARIFTDSRDELMAAVSHSEERMTATDLMMGRYRDGRAVVLRKLGEQSRPAQQNHERARASATLGR